MARQTPRAAYEPERFLAFLTQPPAVKGRRVADTFGGRRRFVRFMDAVQLEFGICFTLEEWERGFSLEQAVELVAAKRAKPDQGLRLAERRLQAARAHRAADPVKFGLLALPLLAVAAAAHSWPIRVLMIAVWLTVIGGVAMLVIREVRYSQRLINRIQDLIRGAPPRRS